MRHSRWAVPPFGAWGVKKKSTAHLFASGQHFSLCGVRVLHDDSIFIAEPWNTEHPVCQYCQRVARPKLGPKPITEKGNRPHIELGWESRRKVRLQEPLLSVDQFEQVVQAKVNFDVQVTRLKLVGSTIYVFVDEGLVPAEHLDWITQKARRRDEVDWVEFVGYVDPINELVSGLVESA